MYECHEHKIQNFLPFWYLPRYENCPLYSDYLFLFQYALVLFYLFTQIAIHWTATWESHSATSIGTPAFCLLGQCWLTGGKYAPAANCWATVRKPLMSYLPPNAGLYDGPSWNCFLSKPNTDTAIIIETGLNLDFEIKSNDNKFSAIWVSLLNQKFQIVYKNRLQVFTN